MIIHSNSNQLMILWRSLLTKASKVFFSLSLFLSFSLLVSIPFFFFNLVVLLHLSGLTLSGADVAGENLENSAYSQSIDNAQFFFGSNNNNENDGAMEMDLANSTDENFSSWIDRPGLFDDCLLDHTKLEVIKEIGAGLFKKEHVFGEF